MKNSKILAPLGFLYSLGINARNFFYRKKILSSYHLGAKTISVGNITVGGTGKTPLVAYLADKLASQGEKVCILTRGYGRDNPKERVLVSNGERILADARDAGDEPFELAHKLIEKAVIVADANRAKAGKWAKDEFGITTFILDDGFQHLRVKRDLDIVILDATNPFGNRNVLPAGTLREPLENLKRANLIVISRANLVENVDEIKSEIKRFNPQCKIFVSKNKFTKLTKIKDFLSEKISEPLLKIQNQKLMAFCALGNPENFFNQLRSENFNVTAVKSFPDHHLYLKKDLRNLEKAAIENGAEVLITTAKDAVKLTHLNFNFPCYFVENELTFEDESEFLNQFL